MRRLSRHRNPLVSNVGLLIWKQGTLGSVKCSMHIEQVIWSSTFLITSFVDWLVVAISCDQSDASAPFISLYGMHHTLMMNF